MQSQAKSSFEAVRVLVVEDHPNMREILWSFMNGFGCTSRITCATIREARQRLADERPDLILVDYMLEDETGLDFLRWLRSSEDFLMATTPVIVVTAHTQMWRIQDIINAGADEILAKPVRADKLYERIAAIVNHRHEFIRIGQYFGPDRRALLTNLGAGELPEKPAEVAKGRRDSDDDVVSVG